MKKYDSDSLGDGRCGTAVLNFQFPVVVMMLHRSGERTVSVHVCAKCTFFDGGIPEITETLMENLGDVLLPDPSLRW